MTTTAIRLTLGRIFLDDHLDRFPDCAFDDEPPSLRYIREGKNTDTVEMSEPAARNLLDDARFYRDEPDFDPQLRQAAARTVAAITRQSPEIAR